MAEQNNFAATMAAIEQRENQSQDNSSTSVNTNGELNTSSENTDTAVQNSATSSETSSTENNTNTGDQQSQDESEVSLSFGGDTSTQNNTTEASQQENTQQYDWKSEIKKIPLQELLKEVGVNDFAIELNSHISNGGKASDYLAAKAIDYSQISDEDLLKESIKSQYAKNGQTISPKQVELLFQRKYTVDEDASDDDKDLMQLQIKTDANDIRQSKIQEQQKFKISDTPVFQTDETYENWKKEQTKQQELVGQLQEFYNGHQTTKALNESKRVAINFGEGVKPLNITVDNPSLITTAMIDGGKTIFQRSINEKGEPDVARQQLGALLALDPYAAVNMIFNYGKSMGQRSKVIEGQNAQRQTVAAPGGESGQGTQNVKQGTFGSLLAQS